MLVEAVITMVGAGTLSFTGWLALKVLEVERKLVDLEARVKAREEDCANHHNWMEQIAGKLDKHGEDLAFIRGKMEKA